MFKRKLYNIIDDTKLHHRSRDDVMLSAITERLNKSLQSYAKDLSLSTKYVENRDSLRVMNSISKRKVK